MRTKPLIVFATIAAMCCTLPSGRSCMAAAPPPTTAPAYLGENAALDYWQAIRWLVGMNEKDRKIVEEQFDTIPLDQVTNIVYDRSTPLKFLRFGAKRPWCDWGLHSDEEGFDTLLPYLNQIRLLAKLGLLRARVELQNGRPQVAADYWAADLALGRHAAPDSITVSLLVDYGIEALTIEHAAKDLNRLDKPALEHFAALLDLLPQGGTLSQSVRVYQGVVDHWLIRTIEQSKGDQWERQLPETLGNKPEELHAIAQACGGTPLAVIEKIRALDPIFDEQAAAMELPYDQFHKVYPPLVARMKANPVSALLSPDFARAYERAALARARLALLRAAIAVVHDGPDAVKSHPDPFGNGPFVYRATDGGFEVGSQLPDPDKEGKPLTLRVGRAATK